MSVVERVSRPARDAVAQHARLRGQVDLGPRVPVLALFALIGLLEFALGPVAYPLAAGFAAGIAIAVASPFVMRKLGPWVAIIVLGLGQFTRPAAASWHFFVLLAGLHLLHVLGALAGPLPWRGWIQPRVLARPLLRVVAIQVPVQLVAAVILLALAPDAHGHRPLSWAGFGLIGVLALAALTLTLIRPLLHTQPSRLDGVAAVDTAGSGTDSEERQHRQRAAIERAAQDGTFTELPDGDDAWR